MDGAVDGLQELPEDRGGDVAEDGAGTAGENGSHEASVEAQAAVADGVDAVVDAVEMAARYAAGDAVLADPELLKLRNRDYPVPTSRNARDR